MDILNFDWCWPIFNACDFYRVHACHPLFNDYPQLIDTWCVKEAFLWFEVEVMFPSDA
jgi:hypothetical protein